jgi:hypothetical protein
MQNHKYGSSEKKKRKKNCKRGAEHVNKQLKGMQMTERRSTF